MNWGAPERLWLLLLLVPLAVLYVAASAWRRRRLARLLSHDSHSVMLAGIRPSASMRRFLLRTGALALCCVALARPQWGYTLQDVSQEGLELLVVLDTSRSMLAQDIRPDRLTRAKYGIRDLLQELDGDRVGLLLFSGGSFLQCPLTIDYSAFRLALEDTYSGIIPRGGTAIGQALRQAIQTFEQSEETDADRAVILITDGDDHEGDPLSLVKTLQDLDIRILTVGVGSREGELIPDEQQGGGFLKNREGEVVKTALNEDMLRTLSLETGGLYVRAVPGDFGLETLYQKGLAGLQTGRGEERTLRVYQDRFVWFLGPAIFLLLCEAVTRERKPVDVKALYHEVQYEG